ncbi:MAG: NifU family protein [Acidobacteria bacterium]|nr:NifU family protein [Acidobacteriota bacterium]
MDQFSERPPRAPMHELVRAALDELLPAMIADGGGAEFVSLENGVATFRLIGSCQFCPSRQLSADAFRRGVQERVPEVAEVVILYQPLPSYGEQLVALAGR